MRSKIAAAVLAAATSFFVSPELSLVVQPVAEDAPVVATRTPTNWILVVDVSGSMGGVLPRIEDHLKRKLARILAEGDTATLVWFSGRGETATIFKAEFVRGPEDLRSLGKMVDRWLRPVGLTAFVDPLKLVRTLAGELQTVNPGAATHMIFLTDGDDNQYALAEILKAVDGVTAAGVSCTWVEFGYYCNRRTMTALSERSGGALVFADDFMNYEPLIEQALRKTITGAPLRKVEVDADAVGGIAYGFNGTDLVPFLVEKDLKAGAHVHVPTDMREVFYLSPTEGAVATGFNTLALAALGASKAPEALSPTALSILAGAFAGVAMFAQRMNPDVVLPLLRALGDVALIRLYQGAFTIQSYQALVDAALAAAREPAGRFLAGYDPTAVPADDCPTIFSLLDILVEGGARVRIGEFIENYERIGRESLDANTVLTDANRTEMGKTHPGLAPLAVFDDTLDSAIAYQAALEAYLARQQAHLAAVKAVLASKRPLRFTADPIPNGLLIKGLGFNSSRANLNIEFTTPGTVDFAGREAEAGEAPQGFEPVPRVFSTFITRAYSLVVDGTINVKTLPLLVDFACYEKLRAAGFVPASPMKFIATFAAIDINLAAIPVINRKMIDAMLAKDIFTRELTKYRAQAEAAVYRNYLNTAFPKQKAPGFAAKYGPDAATWLSSVGANDYGWGPKKTDAKPTDHYIANLAEVSLEGLSAAPSVPKTRERLIAYDLAEAAVRRGDKGAKGPKALPANMTVMVPFMRELDALVDSTAHLDVPAERDAAIRVEAERRLAAAEKTVDDLAQKGAHTAFCLVLGRRWPTDLGSTDKKTMPIEIVDAARGLTISTVGTLDLVPKKIDI